MKYTLGRTSMLAGTSSSEGEVELVIHLYPYTTLNNTLFYTHIQVWFSADELKSGSEKSYISSDCLILGVGKLYILIGSTYQSD
jgi:hypothetical protein